MGGKMNEIESEIKKIIHENELVKVNNTLYLTKYQIGILEAAHIAYQNCSSILELLFLVEEEIANSDGDIEDLEEVAISLQEFQYYHYSNK